MGAMGDMVAVFSYRSIHNATPYWTIIICPIAKPVTALPEWEQNARAHTEQT